MRNHIVVLRETDKGYAAARAMKDRDVGCVLVCDAEGRLSGIVTDRDLMIRGVAEGFDPSDVELRYLMTRDPGALHETQTSIEDALWLMTSLRVRRMPVVNSRGKPVGLVTLDDLLLNERAEMARLREVVRRQMRGSARLRIAAARPAARPLVASADSVSPEEYHLRLEEGADEGEALASRHGAHERQSFGRLVHLARACLEDRALFAIEREKIEAGLRTFLGCLVRRLDAGAAANLVAQLPGRLEEELLSQPAGPDRDLTLAVTARALRRCMHLKDNAQSQDALAALAEAVTESVTTGQIRAICGQLPRELRALFDQALERRAQLESRAQAAS